MNEMDTKDRFGGAVISDVGTEKDFMEGAQMSPDLSTDETKEGVCVCVCLWKYFRRNSDQFNSLFREEYGL